MAGGIKQETGAFSIYGLLLLTLIFLLGAALFNFIHAKHELTRQFLLNTQLHMEAGNGIVIGCEYLALHPEVRSGLKCQTGREQELFVYASESLMISCRVYGVYKENGDIFLLAVSTKDGKEDRLAACLKRRYSGYIFDHWER